MDRWIDADRMAQALIAEMVVLDGMGARMVALPTDHPDALAYAKRLEAHTTRAIGFAQRVQLAMNAPV